MFKLKFLVSGLLIIYSLSACQSKKAKIDLSKIQKVDLSIQYCPCDKNCYTDEINNLTCNERIASFESQSLPDKSHTLMIGITATNQQFPIEQNFNRKSNNSLNIPLNPKIEQYHTETDSGAIGIAVNGIPLFDPSTQAAKHAVTGKRPHTLDVGELDVCGGHAGRGDDYHYHIAPKCLIEEMGRKEIDDLKKPIGYAKDGFSIHALGWFDKKNDIEQKLDACRGVVDNKERYFYNVKSTSKWDIINCFTGQVRELGPRGACMRKDNNGDCLTGLLPIKFVVKNYKREIYGGQICYFLEGRMKDKQIMKQNSDIVNNYEKNGNLFYCNSSCYAYFKEKKGLVAKGRTIQYEFVDDSCPKNLNLTKLKLFDD